MRTQLIIAALLLAAFTLAGCNATPAREPSDNYVLVYLKTGPKSGTQTPEQSKTIFEGHMANIHKLADAGKLVIAGPFDHPHDKSWRGIFVLHVTSVKDAAALVATDPGVQAEVFITELHPMRGPTYLPRTLQLEAALTKQRQAEPQDPKQPPRIRGYVMITAPKFDPAREAIACSAFKDKVLWWADREDGKGVFVLNESKADEVDKALSPRPRGLKDAAIDGWWSSVVVENLK